MSKIAADDVSKVNTELADMEHLICRLFERYDYEETGIISDCHQLHQLTLNAVVKLKIKVRSRVVDDLCTAMFVENTTLTEPWDVHRYWGWFNEHILGIVAAEYTPCSIWIYTVGF